MQSGRFWNHSFPLESLADDHAWSICVPCSMGSFMCCELVVPGECCHETIRHVPPSMDTLRFFAMRGSGNKSWPFCANAVAFRPDVKPLQVLGSSTVNR